MATPDPFWLDEHGSRLPTKPCPRCGANVGPMPLRVENLQHLGWKPYTVQSYQSWCGHTQEIIPFPRPDGSVLFVDRHARYFTLRLAESYLTRPLFRQIVARVERLVWHPT